MALTKFPGGVLAPTYQRAMDLYYGGGQVMWVGNRSGLPAADGSSMDKPISSFFGSGGALARLNGTTNRGHVLFALPGHSESVAAADAASATAAASSFAIVGLGTGTARPNFTWTTATSTWLIDTADVAIDNCNLFLAGADAAGSALTVAAPITVSAPGFILRNNKIRFGFDADQIVTIGITTTAAADEMTLENNHCSGEVAAECTTFMDLIGCDRLRMIGNTFEGGHLFDDRRDCSVRHHGIAEHQAGGDNFYANRKAASVHSVTGLAGVTGISRNELVLRLDDTAVTGFWGTSAGSMAFFNARLVNLAGEHGALPTPISA